MSAPIRPSLADLPGVVAAFSTRSGGVSANPFDSLNLGLTTGDEVAAVLSNQTRFLGAFGLRPTQLARAEQVHGTSVATVEAPGLYSNVDALATNRAGVALAIVAADCAVVLLADPLARVVGAAHAGWRGTAGNIVGQSVAAMKALGASPQEIYAFVSPCISGANFEVGAEVAALFESKYVRDGGSDRRPHVDLKAALHDQLVAAGVSESAVEVSPYCTYDRTDAFYSYRKEGGRTGRMMGFVMLKPGDPSR